MVCVRTRAGSPSRARTAPFTTPIRCRRLTRSSRRTSASCSSEHRKRNPTTPAPCGRTNTRTDPDGVVDGRPAGHGRLDFVLQSMLVCGAKESWMNMVGDTDEAASASEGAGLDPREAAKILEQAKRQARRQFDYQPPLAV